MIVLSLIFLAVVGCQSNSFKLINRNKSPKRLADRMYKVLSEGMESPDPVIRCHSLESLAQLGTLEVRALIRKGLYDPIPAVQFAAAVAVGDVMDHSSRNLLERLRDNDNVSVQLAGGYALEKLGDNRFVRWYNDILFSDDEKLASQACMLIGKLGNTYLRKDSKSQLWRVLRKENQLPPIRLQAAEALARLGDEKVIRNLLIYSGSGYADDRMIAISGLQLIGGPEATAMLTVLVEDPQIEVQLAAMRALGKQAHEEDAKVARGAIDYTDDQGNAIATLRVRQLAILALGAMAKPQDSSLLYNAMSDKSQYIRVAGARATADYLKNIPKPAPDRLGL